MSKYTTQVRFICESKSGLSDSVGCDDVDKVIANSWHKIFSTTVPFFDENYRAVLCQKILKHYYLREICCETVGMWKLWLNTRMEEIMPYYNQLYESAKIKFDPMHDTDLKRTHNRTENEEATGSRTNSTTGSSTSSENGKELYSDTPQGSISGLESKTYLTNATINENNGTSNSTTSGEDNTQSSINTTEDYIETITGKQGAESFSSMLLKFRETFLNIDMMVIEELNDLFFGLW